jgi:dipeptidyl aminopeptidase/acylaminoacyl peptidase
MKYITLLLLLATFNATAQKKPLDHSVYDGWQSIGEKAISKNGKIIVYTITPQEGDGNLIVQQADGTKLIEVPRGYAAKISNDNRFVAFKIKPTFQQTRDARIKKKKPDEMPKDSFGVVELNPVLLRKYPRVKSFKLPEEGNGWLAWQSEKVFPDTTKRGKDETPESIAEEGTLLSLQNLSDGKVELYPSVSEYSFDKKGSKLLLESTANKRESKKAMITVMDLNTMKSAVILAGFNDAKNYAWDDAGNQVAFVAERDSSTKAVQKYYKLYHYTTGYDSARLLANYQTQGVPSKWTVSENGNLSFSKTGKRLLFGLAPVFPPKDTSLPEFERVSVDVWHYNDDDLQPAQLKFLDQELKRSYTATWDWNNQKVVPLANKNIRQVIQTQEGDGNIFYGGTDSGHRVARQWLGYTMSDVYSIDPATGGRTLIRSGFKGNYLPSYSGKYLLMYDDVKKTYSVYNASTKKISAVASSIKVPLYDEENDVPDDPNPHGIVKWMEGDKYVLIYDHYDIWKVDPENAGAAINITNGEGRKNKIVYRVLNVNDEERFLKEGQTILLRAFDESDKSAGLATLELRAGAVPKLLFKEAVNVSGVIKADDANVIAFQKENYQQSPNMFVTDLNNAGSGKQLSWLNAQQSNYNWGTAELFKWKAYTGKTTEGIVYKPENFDPKKKYPMIVYFYDRSSNTLNNYVAPSPTPSRLNISFFVSRGYIVFVPDIWYKTGYPGQSAYDYIVSGTRAVVKQGYVDSTKIGIQGQSWGGYQAAYVITQTPLYAAAWTGAPVANMFSAYGGIRWETGVNRQFQYEHQQSRIGASIWERPDLYTANSPLFFLKKVKTPLVIMSNDADGAVPWYQGIELFTAMRRLNKPVWLLNYNNEAHNLVERRNRKDIQVREQQFFDWILKGEKPAEWLTNGVPAVMKGRDWGLGTQ